VPESKGRDSRSGHYTPQQRAKKQAPNPEWYVPVFVTLLLLGLAWIVVFYVSQGAWPNSRPASPPCSMILLSSILAYLTEMAWTPFVLCGLAGSASPFLLSPRGAASKTASADWTAAQMTT